MPHQTISRYVLSAFIAVSYIFLSGCQVPQFPKSHIISPGHLRSLRQLSGHSAVIAKFSIGDGDDIENVVSLKPLLVAGTQLQQTDPALKNGYPVVMARSRSGSITAYPLSTIQKLVYKEHGDCSENWMITLKNGSEIQSSSPNLVKSVDGCMPFVFFRVYDSQMRSWQPLKIIVFKKAIYTGRALRNAVGQKSGLYDATNVHSLFLSFSYDMPNFTLNFISNKKAKYLYLKAKKKIASIETNNRKNYNSCVEFKQIKARNNYDNAVKQYRKNPHGASPQELLTIANGGNAETGQIDCAEEFGSPPPSL